MDTLRGRFMYRTRILTIAAVLLSIGLGYGYGSSKIPDQVEVVVPSPYEVLVPSPYPVAAEACLDALDLYAEWELIDLGFVLDVYDAYLDYPDENLADFGKRVETLLLDKETPPTSDLDRMDALDAECRAAR